MACAILKMLLVVVALVQWAFCQSFTLQASYTGLDFFSGEFTAYTGYDPTFGYVDYVDIATAEQHGLLSITNVTASGTARWGVDTKAVLDPSANLGRKSLRLQSTTTFKHGLFVLDAAHVPANICGTWPAFWMLGTGIWPYTGEIDIFEMTNSVSNNLMSLHTSSSPGCTVAGWEQTGTLLTNDCASAGSYTGCAVSDTKADAAGTSLNAAGGGVYAMLRTAAGIQIWSFPRSSVPESIAGGKNTSIIPDIREFGIPTANFQGSCDFDANFSEQQLIFNIDFCGSNAGQTYQSHGCPMSGSSPSWSSCNSYVANNPSAFLESYWEINALNIWSMSDAGTPNPMPSQSRLPVASTSSISSLSNVANGGPLTTNSPLTAPTPSSAQVRGLTTFAGATWPVSWITPAPFPSAEAAHEAVKAAGTLSTAYDSVLLPSGLMIHPVKDARSPPPPDAARLESSAHGLMGPRDIVAPTGDASHREHTEPRLDGPRDIGTPLLPARTAIPEPIPSVASQLALCNAMEIGCYTDIVASPKYYQAHSMQATTMTSSTVTTVATVATTLTIQSDPVSLAAESFDHGSVTFETAEATSDRIVVTTVEAAATVIDNEGLIAQQSDATLPLLRNDALFVMALIVVVALL